MSTRAFLVPARTLACVALLTVGCDKGSADTVPPQPAAGEAPAEPVRDETPPPTAAEDDRVQTVLAMEHRSEDNRARDGYRHPAETLAFLGVEPEHTVVELWPGSGWYTEILAPYLADSGQLIVTMYDTEGPEEYYGTRQAKELSERLKTQADVFGDVKTVTVPQEIDIEKGKVDKITVKPFELAPAGTVDVVLTFRNSHGWFNRDAQELIYGAAFEALKPGGVFGVVQHRADEGADPKETAKKGYLPEQTVIDAAEAVGFELAERSEVNANPKDTKDHPEGVWTLPPTLALKDKDRDKYLEIGESDRMTLKFVKPE